MDRKPIDAHRRSDRGDERRREPFRVALDDLGADRADAITRPRARAALGRARRRACWPATSPAPETGAHGRRGAARRRRPRHSRAELRRRRYERAASAGRSPGRFRGASASTDRARRRGPTARAAGTAISRADEIPARRRSRRRAGSGRRTAPVVDGDVLATIGEGGYADGIRARDHPRSADGDRQGDARRHAGGAARRQRALPRALAHAAARRR